MYQVNVTVPNEVQPGNEVQFVLTQDGVPFNTATFAAPDLSGTFYGMPHFGWLAGFAGGLLGLAVIRRRRS